MKILITGGAGFLGQNLVKACADCGHEVNILDLRPSKFPVLPIERYCNRIDYDVDITKPESLPVYFQEIDAVFHLAGLISFWQKARAALMNINVAGTKNVLEAAMEAGVTRLVHVSSVAAIGFGPADPIDENFSFAWDKVPQKHYMVSKHLAELEVLSACERGLGATIVNPGLMWGPGDMTNSSKLIIGLRKAAIPFCPPGGTNIVDVRDVASGLISFLDRGNFGQRYILGGYNLSFQEVYRIIAAALSVAPPRFLLPHFLKPVLYGLCLMNERMRSVAPPLTSDNIDSSFMCRYFSSARAEKEMGWTKKFTFEQTIRDSVDWLRANHCLD